MTAAIVALVVAMVSVSVFWLLRAARPDGDLTEAWKRWTEAMRMGERSERGDWQ